jgi:hypothetical protein
MEYFARNLTHRLDDGIVVGQQHFPRTSSKSEFHRADLRRWLGERRNSFRIVAQSGRYIE